jgi:hypothetical protein
MHTQQKTPTSHLIGVFFTCIPLSAKRGWSRQQWKSAPARSSPLAATGSLRIWGKASNCCGRRLWIARIFLASALEAAPQAPHIWVYPPTKAADGILVNPVYPPEYRDFILVFPASSGVKPVYIVLTVPGDFSYHPAPVSLPAFPDVKPAPLKTSVRSGGKKRRRWKDSSGKIYEWDSQHGKVEMYTKQGKHLGEYDPQTGEQTKPADSTRRVEK